MMNAGNTKITMQTAMIISGAVALVVLILLWAATGFGFWGAFFIGLLFGIAAFVLLLIFYTETSLSDDDTGDKAPPRTIEAGTGASLSGSGSEKPSPADMARPAGGVAAAKSASVGDTAERKSDIPAVATKPGSGSATGATGATPHPGAAGVSAVKARPDADGGASASVRADTGAAGQKPATLSAPRDGKADNLKEIKGVGPKLETNLNEMGYYHFDQIAAWSTAEVAWVDENLKGFKGRVSRDNWVDQARVLAAGGETEFSKKVDKGGVY